MDRIDILLATYNGAAFLNQQLGSVESQTHRNWRLIVRDDGSTDKTPEIIEAFRARHPDKVVVLRDEDGNLGVVRNFSRLMEHAGACYVAFCDQDDVWKPEKLKLSLQEMRALEAEHGPEKPLLVFSDLTVVDENLKVIRISFWKYQGLRPERCNILSRLLFQNVVTGCTTLMNKPLVDKSMPIPAEAVVHDWWVALVAAAFGFAGHMEKQTVLYRQHGENILGARPLRLTALPHLIRQFLGAYQRHRASMLSRFTRAEAFLERYDGSLSDDQAAALNLFVQIPTRNIIARLLCVLKNSMAPSGFWRACLYVLLSSGKPPNVASG